MVKLRNDKAMFVAYRPNAPSYADRLKRVRTEKDGTEVYVDVNDPHKKEFFISNLRVPKTVVAMREAEHPLIKETHPKYPEFGPYFFDEKDGRDVFINDGKPFYVGIVAGVEHKIYIGPRFDDRNFRSRASAPHSVIDSPSGGGSLGGVGSQ